MAEGNKSERATPKKRRDERKKGNVFLSKDAIAVVSLLATFFVLKLLAGGIVSSLDQFYQLCMEYAKNLSVGQVTGVVHDLVLEGVWVFAQTAGIIMVVASIISIAATFFQTKMLVSGQSMKPKWNRISPLQGFKRLFSLRSVVESLKGILKISVLLYIIYRYIHGMTDEFFNYINIELGVACSQLFQRTFSMILQIIVAFAALAILDVYYQWWDYENKLKMTKQEVKEEYKQVEGDPKIKAKIKETQRKMAQSRMMQSVPKADVIIRNPQHVAIALRYQPDVDNAPIVLAKGLDELALRIVKVAEEHQISVIENVPLARALYADSELNREIPASLYGAVADVLVYLYRLGSKKQS